MLNNLLKFREEFPHPKEIGLTVMYITDIHKRQLSVNSIFRDLDKGLPITDLLKYLSENHFIINNSQYKTIDYALDDEYLIIDAKTKATRRMRFDHVLFVWVYRHDKGIEACPIIYIKEGITRLNLDLKDTLTYNIEFKTLANI